MIDIIFNVASGILLLVVVLCVLLTIWNVVTWCDEVGTLIRINLQLGKELKERQLAKEMRQ